MSHLQLNDEVMSVPSFAWAIFQEGTEGAPTDSNFTSMMQWTAELHVGGEGHQKLY